MGRVCARMGCGRPLRGLPTQRYCTARCKALVNGTAHRPREVPCLHCGRPKWILNGHHDRPYHASCYGRARSIAAERRAAALVPPEPPPEPPPVPLARTVVDRMTGGVWQVVWDGAIVRSTGDCRTCAQRHQYPHCSGCKGRLLDPRAQADDLAPILHAVAAARVAGMR